MKRFANHLDLSVESFDDVLLVPKLSAFDIVLMIDLFKGSHGVQFSLQLNHNQENS